MTVPLDSTNPDKRLAGHGRDIAMLKRRQQLPSLGGINHWVEAEGGFTSIASDGGAPSSPTPVNVSISGITAQSDGGSVYFVTAGSPNYVTVAEPGGYRALGVASFPEGLSGYINVSLVIGGDATLGFADAPRFIPASYTGVGGGVVEFSQSFEVLDTAVVGTATEVGVFPTVWQNSGSAQSGLVFVRIERLT
jgi:hypothetical protein